MSTKTNEIRSNVSALLHNADNLNATRASSTSGTLSAKHALQGREILPQTQSNPPSKSNWPSIASLIKPLSIAALLLSGAGIAAWYARQNIASTDLTVTNQTNSLQTFSSEWFNYFFPHQITIPNGIQTQQIPVEVKDFKYSGNYTGEMEDGRPFGQGVMHFPAESPIDNISGQWRNMTGNPLRLAVNGTITWKNGNTATGQLYEYGLIGPGTTTYAQGLFKNVTGDWFVYYDGTLAVEGRAFVSYRNGDTYEGDVTADAVPQGLGKVVFVEGPIASYEGYWIDGKMDNRAFGERTPGTVHYRDGRVYIGDMSKGLCNGQGKLLAADGTVLFEGRWRNGAQVNV